MLSFSYAQRPASYVSGYGRHVQVRPLVMLAATVTVVAFGLLRAYAVYMTARQMGDLSPAAIVRPLKHVARVAAATTTTPSSSAASTQTARQTPAVQPPTVTPASTVIPPLPACTPDGYSSPSLINLANAQTGVTQVVDPIHYYTIYGYDGSQVRQQIIDCAPRLTGDSEFTGYTSYRLNWQYQYMFTGSACRLSDIRIGMHVGVVMPAWQASPYAEAGFADKWRTFMTDLNTHEQGHVQLDTSYAQTILSDLQHFSAASCENVQQNVNALVKRDISTLNATNDNYDATTDHGATQGAILPS